MATTPKTTTTAEPVPVTADNFNRAESHMSISLDVKKVTKSTQKRLSAAIDSCHTKPKIGRRIGKLLWHCFCYSQLPTTGLNDMSQIDPRRARRGHLHPCCRDGFPGEIYRAPRSSERCYHKLIYFH
jgi:hypothetical protein